MNSENSKTSHPHRFLLKLIKKADSGRGEKSVSLSDLCINYRCKFNYLLQHGMIN